MLAANAPNKEGTSCITRVNRRNLSIFFLVFVLFLQVENKLKHEGH
jgi:hypothetical protein